MEALSQRRPYIKKEGEQEKARERKLWKQLEKVGVNSVRGRVREMQIGEYGSN